MAVADHSPDERQPLLASETGPHSSDPQHSEPASEASGQDGRLPAWGEELYAEGKPEEVVPSSLISGNEIRAAASKDPYPSWIYGALVTPVDADAPLGTTQNSASSVQVPHQPLLQGLQEEEIRELLIDYVSKHCCWGPRPANRWKIQKVEDCNAYFGALETFIEERDVLEVTEPYSGEFVDGKKSGRVSGPWEVDMRAEFPLLFTAKKVARVQIPNSEFMARCADCSGRGELPCPSCNLQGSGNNQSGKVMVCPACHGRGLIAHLDGSDSNCTNCKGVGKLPCSTCRSFGKIKCGKCDSKGALIARKVLLVTWQTLWTKKVAASSHAASVPDEVFHRAKGANLFSAQAQRCQPVIFPDLPGLTKFSSDVVAERAAVPSAARVICERHQINFIPVTRVVMAHGNRSFEFYIVGLHKEIYLKDYPYKCCSGICCCQCSCTVM
ncbi:hypothetical protein O6H91_12G050200 [Diphasiastrum complanatum]|uniref:Uncharacterized protein n=1 Tax=Diphasiastrum complanatum TaxID=34168 RepID=A0ACC2C208_DIPCM|nr:hypothetical protein O6H91_12G050200 [Diphasiastrum complanatum]